ncbi:hypothetical protein ACLOJK_024966 [Asimina triloba]
MVERNVHSLGPDSRKSLFYLFTISTFLLIFSWFFFLRSASHPHFIEHSALTTGWLFAGRNYQSSLHRNEEPFSSLGSSMYDEKGNPEEQELERCDPNKAILKVYMYDLPPEFHFGLLGWKQKTGSMWPDLRDLVPEYPGGLNLQHSIEYWLTLDLLSSRSPDRPGPCTAVRVDNSSKANVIFVPFFSSLSFNRFSKLKPFEKKSQNKVLQDKLVKFLTAQEEWKRSGGRDHVILAHHPNSMLDARMALWPGMFILADFGRYPLNIANVEKDVIAPYKHVVKTFVNDTSGFDSRPTLLFFQGSIYRKDGGFARQELFYLLKDEKDVHFSFGTIHGNGIPGASQGMHSSKFCLNIAGDTPSSNRLFDAIASHCVPVIISDEIELPYEDVLDYSKFCIFVRTSDALKAGFLIKLIRSITKDEWTQMWQRLKQVEHYFEFQYPSQKDDAVQMIWQAVARKAAAVHLKIRERIFKTDSDPILNDTDCVQKARPNPLTCSRRICNSEERKRSQRGGKRSESKREMRRVFGAKKEKEPPPSIQDASDRFSYCILSEGFGLCFCRVAQFAASNAINKRGGTVDEKIKTLDAELTRYKEQIKKTRPGPAQEAVKARAMRVLKQKRMSHDNNFYRCAKALLPDLYVLIAEIVYSFLLTIMYLLVRYEGQRDMLYNQTFNLDQVAFASEGIKDAQQTMTALKTANKELKGMMKTVKIQDIDNMQDEMMDLMDVSSEIQESLGRSYSVPDDIDEEELMGELDALEADMGTETESEGMPAYLQPDKEPDLDAELHLPSAPSGHAAAPNRQNAQPEDELGLPAVPQASIRG